MKLFGYELIFRKVQPIVKESVHFEVGRLDVYPGDTIVFCAPGYVPRAEAEMMVSHMQAAYPGNKIMVLSDGIKPMVLGSAQLTH